MANRPWYRLHWLTWLALACVAGGLAYANVNPAARGIRFGGVSVGRLRVLTTTFRHGWPWRCADRTVTTTWNSATRTIVTQSTGFQFRPLLTLASSAVNLAVLIGTGAVVERLCRARWQFSLMALMLAIWTVAALFLLAQSSDRTYLGELGSNPLGGVFGIIEFMPRLVILAVIFGLGRALHMAGWLVVWVSGRLLRVVGQRRHAAEA
jgi:hypothetical protein